MYNNEVIFAVSEVCSLIIRHFGQGRFHADTCKLNICTKQKSKPYASAKALIANQWFNYILLTFSNQLRKW